MARQPAPYARYIETDDILYVRLRDQPIVRTGETNIWTNIDYAADGSVVAVEMVNAKSAGIDLTDVPEREAVEQLIREARIVLPLTSHGR
ncbi:MAG: DUF2283 domain-containing protein [Dehalococcoidia bacterium]